ncbi:hypothetical protein LA20533_00630 [Amylolactobacillus amylophilus DSM 20533 = JCM 1125]|uniref:ABC transporter domain-containing protein n=5 Tax=Amylolactobacillus TaxID=2767876 RepID=A0A1L6XAB5_9LACO|nr:hypothetical protein LA20533_00630 [Amylolactobacillus amylophilus DSM 20533 = JCM 1125]GED79851.1 dipeptide/oligopeptide/nickel ABC transporter ATP-binding protein [Amylolactobacillus amylophilus]
MSTQSNLLLEVRDLNMAYQVRKKFYNVLTDINFSLARGEILAVVGESGTGKSTLASSILGLYDKDNTAISGQIKLDGRDRLRFRHDSLNNGLQDQLGVIVNNPLTILNPFRRIGAELNMVLQHNGINKASLAKFSAQFLKYVGMPEARSLLKLFPAELSAELQQRVAVALALMGNPTMIVADDPTRGFDKIVQAQILNLLVEYCTEKHAGMIILSQDMGVAAEVADQLAIMYEGQIVEYGSAATIFHNPLHPYTRRLLNVGRESCCHY